MPYGIFNTTTHAHVRTCETLEQVDSQNCLGCTVLLVDEEMFGQPLSWDGSVVTVNLEYFWNKLREERDRRLLACDYRVLPDFPHSAEDLQDWIDYRQLLRDLPEVTVDPREPEWPTPPS